LTVIQPEICPRKSIDWAKPWIIARNIIKLVKIKFFIRWVVSIRWKILILAKVLNPGKDSLTFHLGKIP